MNTIPQAKSIRVVHLTSVHTPFDTRIFYKQLQSLLKAGYNVILIAVHTHDEVVDGVQVRAVPKPRGRFERMLRTAWRVTRLAWRENADLYHIHDPELLPWIQFLRLRGKTVIFDMHENVPKDILSKEWIQPALRQMISLLYRLLEQVLLWRMPIVFAEDSYLDDYQWVSHRHVVILNTPIADDLMTITEPRYARPTVGFIGGVNADRGSLMTLQALHQLRQRGYTVDWDCVGPLTEAHRAEMESLAERYNLEGVRIHGYMLPRDGHRLMARCHIGLAVLMPVPNAVSSYPTKMFEYMTLGLPVIASGFPLYREVIESAGCGLCIDNPNNPLELADAIQWLLEHPQEAEAMGQRGREVVQKQYNWAVEAEKLSGFYKKLNQSTATG